MRLQGCEAGKCGRAAGCEGGASCLLSLMPSFCVADVDECVTGTHNCQAGFSCQNTKGSFYCQARQRCMDGFLQDPEGNCVGKQAAPVAPRVLQASQPWWVYLVAPFSHPQRLHPLRGYVGHVQKGSCSAHLGAVSFRDSVYLLVGPNWKVADHVF